MCYLNVCRQGVEHFKSMWCKAWRTVLNDISQGIKYTTQNTNIFSYALPQPLPIIIVRCTSAGRTW